MRCPTCLEDVRVENSSHCSRNRNHSSCINCIRTYIKIEIGRGNVSFRCMTDENCAGSMAETDKKSIMGDELFDAYSKREQIVSLDKANIDGLYYCPLCNIPSIHDPAEDGDVFWCVNDSCKVPTCVLCKKKCHWDSDCRRDEKTDKRKRMEEAETMKAVRTCPKCNVDIVKTHGCNKVTCKCGSKMCWTCGRDINREGYTHFDMYGGCTSSPVRGDNHTTPTYREPDHAGQARYPYEQHQAAPGVYGPPPGYQHPYAMTYDPASMAMPMTNNMNHQQPMYNNFYAPGPHVVVNQYPHFHQNYPGNPNPTLMHRYDPYTRTWH